MKILAQLSNRGPLGEFGTEALPAALMVGPAIPSQWALQPTLLFFLQLTQWALQSTLLFFLDFSQWAPQSSLLAFVQLSSRAPQSSVLFFLQFLYWWTIKQLRKWWVRKHTTNRILLRYCILPNNLTTCTLWGDERMCCLNIRAIQYIKSPQSTRQL